MLDDKEKKTDEEVDAKPTSEKKEEPQTEKKTDRVHKLIQILKSIDNVIDEMLVEDSIPNIAVSGMLITSFCENMQNKMILVLKRNTAAKDIIDNIDAEHKAKREKETVE